jgi:hypothetical protein
LFNWLGRKADGRLWAVKSTADEYAMQFARGNGEDVYREGSDVDLGAYPAGQFNRPAGTDFFAVPSLGGLAAALSD